MQLVANATNMRSMNLKEYFSSPDAPSIKSVALDIGLPNSTQLRHWIHGYQGRKPGAGYCRKLEEATNKLVTRKDLRPNDWQDIWPELAEKTEAAST